MAANIFINYRKEDSRWSTQALYNELLKYFPKESLFKDFNTIDIGGNYRKIINDALSECDVMLVVIGKDWIQIKNKRGSLRLQDPDDLLRVEISTAIKRGIEIIPLLYDNIEMIEEHELPEDLKELASRQCLSISDLKFSADIEMLAAAINKILHKKQTGSSIYQSSRPAKYNNKENNDYLSDQGMSFIVTKSWLPAAAITGFVGALLTFIAISVVFLKNRTILPKYSVLTPIVIRDAIISGLIWFITGAFAKGKKFLLLSAIITAVIALIGWLIVVQLTVHAAHEPYVIAAAITFGLSIGSLTGVLIALPLQKRKDKLANREIQEL